MGQQTQRRYFVAVFGDQIGPPSKNSISDGRYIPYQSWTNHEHIGERDLILLYCTGTYIGYDKEVPGVGVAFHVQPPAIFYSYLPLDRPISLNQMRSGFTPTDRGKLDNLRFNAFRIFEVSDVSFRQAVKTRYVNWNKM